MRHAFTFYSGVVSRISGLSDAQAFDVIFVDPPFQSRMILDVLSFLLASPYLHEKTWVYVEMDKRDFVDFPPAWVVVRDKVAGQVRAVLLQHLRVS